MRIRTVVIAASLVLCSACTVQSPRKVQPVAIKLIAINDFHGQLESPGALRRTEAPGSVVPVGGIDWLAGYIELAKSNNAHTAVVSAGDLIGASPLVSALFHDEPTIEAMNRLGLDVNAVGNHEFDEGRVELLRMQRGGCHPTDPNSCKGDEVGTPVPFEGAHFEFLAANVVDAGTAAPLFRPYVIKEYDGARVAFIGVTLKDTPSVVSPSGVAGLAFKDEAETVNALVPELLRNGADAIVVLIHQGGTTPTRETASTINRCERGLEGSPIKDIVGRLNDAVDLVISAHTHQAYNCRLPNRAGRLIPVTSTNAQGRVLTDIDLAVNPFRHDVAVVARNAVLDRTDSGVVPDPGMKTLVYRYNEVAKHIADRVIGSITAGITRSPTAAGESALGDLIADAQLAATAGAGQGAAQIAFTNPGGIRADLAYPSSKAGEGDGRVSYGEVFAVQPFGNSLVTLTLTGAQIHTLLEQQFAGCRLGFPAGEPEGQPGDRMLQVSAGFSYAWSVSAPPCAKVDPAGIKLNGVTVEPAARYRVTVSSFLADGGDKFHVLTQGSERVVGIQDIDALESYLNAHGPVAPGPRDRIELGP